MKAPTIIGFNMVAFVNWAYNNNKDEMVHVPEKSNLHHYCHHYINLLSIINRIELSK